MYYKYKYSPSVSAMGTSGFLSPEGIFDILDDVANRHIYSVGVDLMTERNLTNTTWVILSWNVKILRQIPNHASLDVTTWISSSPNQFSHIRQFTMADSEGNDLVYGCSESSLVDTQSGTFIKISPEAQSLYGCEDREVIKRRLIKRQKMEHFTEHSEIALRKSDIDYNCHVHNTRYLSYIIESLPESVLNGRNISDFVISYRQALLPENKTVIVNYSLMAEGVSAILTLPDGTQCASAELFF